MDNESEYRTDDLGLACYLYIQGNELIKLDHSTYPRSTFIFKDYQPELIAGWQKGEAPGNCFSYFEAVAKLKARLYRELNREGKWSKRDDRY